MEEIKNQPNPEQPETPSEEINVSIGAEPPENLSIKHSFRLTPSADIQIKKMMRFIYLASREGLIPPEVGMKEETLQAYVVFSFNCARLSYEDIKKRVQ
jgi:hypothetical protein